MEIGAAPNAIPCQRRLSDHFDWHLCARLRYIRHVYALAPFTSRFDCWMSRIDWIALGRTHQRGMLLRTWVGLAQGEHASRHRRNKWLQRCAHWQRALVRTDRPTQDTHIIVR